MSNKSLPTAEEIVNSLKRSFIPTLVIEGKDDTFIYRFLKSKINVNQVALQPCGGRNTLFSVYDHRSEFKEKNIVFIADRDAYRFKPIPEDKKEIIFTTGYCIENDIYAGSNIYEFLDDEYRAKHSLLMEIIGKWFSFEVEKFINNGIDAHSLEVSNHINEISPIGLNKMCPEFALKINYKEPSGDIFSIILSDYNLNLRGKQLFQMLSRFLSTKGRFSSFNDKNLIEIAIKNQSNLLISELIEKINSSLSLKCSNKSFNRTF